MKNNLNKAAIILGTNITVIVGGFLLTNNEQPKVVEEKIIPTPSNSPSNIVYTRLEKNNELLVLYTPPAKSTVKTLPIVEVVIPKQSPSSINSIEPIPSVTPKAEPTTIAINPIYPVPTINGVSSASGSTYTPTPNGNGSSGSPRPTTSPTPRPRRTPSPTPSSSHIEHDD